jgi:predicted SAM-dependent methyltransferase
LNIGGRAAAPGWELFDARPGPGVDHVGNVNDLSRFADGSFDTVYASHVLEHLDYQGELQNTLAQCLRVLKPGGVVQISVPDMETLCRLMLKPGLSKSERYTVMRMMFGGHIHPFDYHQVGLTQEFLHDFLADAGFVDIQHVSPFKHFFDNSDMKFSDEFISLNMQARRP